MVAQHSLEKFQGGPKQYSAINFNYLMVDITVTPFIFIYFILGLSKIKLYELSINLWENIFNYEYSGVNSVVYMLLYFCTNLLKVYKVWR